MSDRERALLVALAIALAPGAAAAQQSAAALQGRLATLEAAAAHADSVARRADSVLQARRVLDTVRAGALRVITDSAVASKIRGPVAHVWTALATHLGSDTMLLRRPFGVIAMRGTPFPVTVEAMARVDTAPGRDDISEKVLGTVEAALIRRAGARFRGWDGTLGFDTDSTRLFNLAYVMLVTAPSRATRLCRAGDASACAAALGLGADSDRAAAWYNANDLRVVLGRGMSMRYAREARMLASCRAGADSVCRDLAALRGPSLPAPLGVAARTSLVAFAVARGGEGAYGRLLADSSAPVSMQLASAARMPFAALMDAWRIRVLRAAPPGTTGTPVRAEFAAVGWIAVLMALALRSARWRLD